MSKKVMLQLLISITLMLMASSCTIGIKEKETVLLVSPVPIPEAAKGAPMIATNDKIRLCIINREDEIYYQKVTGYVLVDPQFYGKLIEAYKKVNK